jgi:hypothetical protein
VALMRWVASGATAEGRKAAKARRVAVGSGSESGRGEKECRDNCRADWLENPNEALGFHAERSGVCRRIFQLWWLLV